MAESTNFPSKPDPSSSYPTPLSESCPSPRDAFVDHDAGCIESSFHPSTSSSLTLSTSLLLQLPSDLLLLLSDHFSPPSLLSLRLTCTSLHRLLPAPTPPHTANHCALTAAARHLASHSDALAFRARCALCKALSPLSIFHRAAILSPSLAWPPSPAATPPGLSGDEDDDEDCAIATGQSLSRLSDDTVPFALDPRICAWHITRFVFPPTAALAPDPAFEALIAAAAGRGGAVELRAAARVAMGRGWASSVERCCMHCGRVVVCVCSLGGCGRCACDCDGCGVREVRCWWKLAGAGREGSFLDAKRRWLVARAEEMERFGWDGSKLRALGLLDWGMVRVVKCAMVGRRVGGEGSRKRKAESG